MRFSFIFSLLLFAAAVSASSREDILRQALLDASAGKIPQALNGFETALKMLKPSENEMRGTIHSNIGTALAMLGRDREALEHWMKTIELQPNNADIRGNVVKGLSAQGRQIEAIEVARVGVKLHPQRASSYNDVGYVAHELHLMEEALNSLETATNLDPTNFHSYFSLGSVLRDLNRQDEALKVWGVANQINPTDPALFMASSVVKGDVCHWGNPLAPKKPSKSKKKGKRGGGGEEETIGEERRAMGPATIASHIDTLKKMMKIGEETMSDIDGSALHPLLLTYYMDEPELLKRVLDSKSASIRRRGAQGYPPFKYIQTLPNSVIPPSRRLRVGFLSADMRDHPTAWLMRGMFDKLKSNKKGIESWLFSNTVDDGSSFYKEIKQEVEHWEDCRSLSQPEVAQKINSLQIDILVDLKQHTQEAMLIVVALAPTPVTGIYLGFPGGVGANMAQFMITDRIVTPPESQSWYQEKLAILPNSYQVNNYFAEFGTSLASTNKDAENTDELSLICLNHPRKIKPPLFAVWMNIMKKVSSARLHLLVRHELAAKNLKAEAASFGIDTSRIVIEDVLPKREHMERYRSADLFLDSSPYSAHTTASEALFEGLPLISFPGKGFASRVGASLLSALPLQELIVRTEKEYQALAVALASHPSKLRSLRSKIESLRNATPLFNQKTFVSGFEKSLKMQWDIFSAGLSSFHIVVV